jgi:CheY-like chemotaxis protein
MPMMDGFAVMRELRRDPTFADVPIMVLTAVLEDASHRRYELETGRSMRVQEYIEKPVAPAELLHRVEQLLQRTAS